jgi:hypothetical protein
MLVVIWRDQSTGYATLSTALHTQELSLTPMTPTQFHEEERVQMLLKYISTQEAKTQQPKNP